MRAFIKDIRTFKTLAHCAVFGYEVKRSIYDTVSTININLPSVEIKEGDIVYLDGINYFGIIDSITLNGKCAELGVKQVIELFSRRMFYEEADFRYLEDNLKELIETRFKNCTDAFYRLPYLDVTAKTHTASQLLPSLDEGTFSVKSYAAKIRRLYNIFFEWDISRLHLGVRIVRKTESYRNVDFSHPQYIVTEQSFSKNGITKLTSKCEETGEILNWVLLSDGSIIQGEPLENRLVGEWDVITVDNEADVLDAVKNELLKNEYSHRVSFQAPKSSGFNLYDRLRLKLDGKIFSSYVSGVTENMDSDVVEIQCGELQTQYPYLKFD